MVCKSPMFRINFHTYKAASKLISLIAYFGHRIIHNPQQVRQELEINIAFYKLTMMSLKLFLLVCIAAVATAEQSRMVPNAASEFGTMDVPNLLDEDLSGEFDSRMLQTSMSTSSTATVSETSTVSTPTTTIPVTVEPAVTTPAPPTPPTTTTTSTSEVTTSGQSIPVGTASVSNVAPAAAGASSGVNAGVIAGAVVGAVAAIVGAGYLVYRRKQQEEEETPAAEEAV